MNTHYHTPSFGDDVFDMGDAAASTPNSHFVSGNTGKSSTSYLYQQTPPSTKRMISVYNTSDEYHTANEDSFNAMNNTILQQNINASSNTLSGGQGGMTTPTSTTGPTTMAARKQMIPVEQVEPAKPLSAYALFFRDTVSAIKQQNPTCSFQELSKIVASMWDALDPVHKGVYNKKNELARTEYLKQMRIYQQQQQQKLEQCNTNANEAVQADTNVHQQTQQVAQSVTNNVTVQQNVEQVNNNNVATAAKVNPATTVSSNSGAPSDDQLRLNEEGSVQKCTRENCNKRAIINPDWEDEYCSNECVIIHCRNVFNTWVQSNLEAKQQQQQLPTQHTTVT